MATGDDTQQERSSGKQRRLDSLDQEIIRILQKNGRTPNTDVARQLDVTETTIRNRVARLLDEGFIEIVAVPTPMAIGLSLSAIIGISTRLGEVRAVADQLVKCPEVRYVGLSTGRYDIMIEAFFNGHEHLLEFVSEGIGSLDGVEDAETSIILKVPKFSYEWELP
jgi:Lrp/AsnC family transcriptional regulator, regulator for asnA, asnC and gidA